MRKNSTAELLKQCKVTELIIDTQKEYVVSVEVGNMNLETTMRLMKGVEEIFKSKLKLDNCIFMPMRNGKEMISIRDLKEEEADLIVQLYNKIKQS